MKYLHNLCKIFVNTLALFGMVVNICSLKLSFLLVVFNLRANIVATYALFFGKIWSAGFALCKRIGNFATLAGGEWILKIGGVMIKLELVHRSLVINDCVWSSSWPNLHHLHHHPCWVIVNIAMELSFPHHWISYHINWQFSGGQRMCAVINWIANVSELCKTYSYRLNNLFVSTFF